ncbi:amidohydrolase family protein [Nocardioides sp. YIM 152315]|uniref:N-acetylglucosamine-6-phosphate deacetylase n=1 Tax=Nocardioides sp. YIM 152315 TaxID=3031760 RepID=UPI0023DA633C|nr:amidohydrolase family protein [Nocardioides sp. YIM 152315]MDF1604248.1 amidohydrolase family protein [Nocardioides sp. YIM 152315]
MTTIPGLVDIQVNGAAGIDLTDEPHRLWEVAAALPAHGVVAFVPTVITSDPAARERALATFAAGPPAGWSGAEPLGLHFEGPMIAPARKGAHPEHWLRPPSLDIVDGWSREAGVVIATIAPELPGALEVIERLVDRGILVSVGHTAAGTADVVAAVEAGARWVTHLGNAMAPMLPREPGPVGVALGGDDLAAGLIVDGHHLDPHFVRAAWRALGPERFVSVSDTTAALGLPDGPTRLGDQDVVVAGGTVRLADGTLAGSAASLLDCLRVLVAQTGCTLDDAVATATTTPLGLLGLPAREERIRLTDDLRLAAD